MSQAEQFFAGRPERFDFGGQVVGAVRYGSGHINDTFCVHTQPGEDPAAGSFSSVSALPPSITPTR